jgi:hypothetical protein
MKRSQVRFISITSTQRCTVIKLLQAQKRKRNFQSSKRKEATYKDAAYSPESRIVNTNLMGQEKGRQYQQKNAVPSKALF